MTIRTPSPVIASASGTSMADLAGRTFYAATMTAITHIQVMLKTPSVTIIAISPMLDPTQHNPNPKPRLASSRQRRRNCGRHPRHRRWPHPRQQALTTRFH